MKKIAIFPSIKFILSEIDEHNYAKRIQMDSHAQKLFGNANKQSPYTWLSVNKVEIDV